MNIKRVAVIGAGASGMICAIEASKKGHIVEIFEKSSKVGRKIYATGNGRCNISNIDISIDNYHGKEPSFVKRALDRFDLKRYFSSLGLEIVEGSKGRLYPMSLQSSSVVELLSFKLKKEGIKVHLSHEVGSIKRDRDIFIIDNREFDIVVIATGSKAMPKLGSSDSGYLFAQEFNHKIVRPFASLVQLISSNKIVKSVSGVKVDAELTIFVDGVNIMSIRGDLLFTNYGLSGSAILDLSRVASMALLQKKDVKISIDLTPDISYESLKALLTRRLKIDLPLKVWLNGIVHKKVVDLIIDQAKLKGLYINKKIINTLAYTIKNIIIDIDSTKGIESCEVVAGGVSTKDIDSKSMESKLQKGLYFCGEVLDIDGDCGGYNLHFAFASGYLAGNSI